MNKLLLFAVILVTAVALSIMEKVLGVQLSPVAAAGGMCAAAGGFLLTVINEKLEGEKK